MNLDFVPAFVPKADVTARNKEHMENIKPPFTVEDDKVSKVAYKQTVAYDDEGNVIYDVVKKPYKANGSGFVLTYSEKCTDFVKKVNSGATVRVFFYLAMNQCYGDKGIFGCRCSKKYLSEILGLDLKSIYNAIKYLKDNFLVHVGRYGGQLEFMVSPYYVTIGTDKKKRVAEWDKRWRDTWQRKNPTLGDED